MKTCEVERASRMSLGAVSWQDYYRFLKLFDGRGCYRLTYRHKVLEIIEVSGQRRQIRHWLGRIFWAVALELRPGVKCGGQTTLRRRSRRCGLDPDHCYWIKNSRNIVGAEEVDVDEWPPPDLVIEVATPRSELNRMRILALLGVPEVWRSNGKTMTMHQLGADGKYAAIPASPTAPFLRPEDLTRFVSRFSSGLFDENEVISQVRDWIREQLAKQPPTTPP